MIWLDPLRDVQRQLPSGWCARCGAELYPYDSEICAECKEELESDSLRNRPADYEPG